MPSRLLLLITYVLAPIFAGQAPAAKPTATPPQLPWIDYNACPFEGCTFGKWIVKHESTIFTTWKEGRKPWATLRKGEIVNGLTGVHITYEPDRIEVLKPIPELGLQPGDMILRYMYRGEGFADLWANGQWKKEYDSSFITEKNASGCLSDCSARVVSEGRKDWWVRVKTSAGKTGWTKVEDQFNCMDSLGGDEDCDKLTPSNPN
jgi:hypothetical protein